MYVAKTVIMDKVTFKVSETELEFNNSKSMNEYIKFVMSNRLILNVTSLKVYQYNKTWGSKTLFIYDRINHICQNSVTKRMWSVYDDPFIGY